MYRWSIFQPFRIKRVLAIRSLYLLLQFLTILQDYSGQVCEIDYSYNKILIASLPRRTQSTSKETPIVPAMRNDFHASALFATTTELLLSRY